MDGKFANRLQVQIRVDLLSERARRKQERWWEEGRGAKIYVYVARRPRNWRGTGS